MGNKFGELNTCYRHGFCYTKFYRTYMAVKSRCDRESSQEYQRYGARGIQNEWKTFEDFRGDMYEGYLEHEKLHGSRYTTLDRIDNNGNYCKENCRWATPKIQANNRRNNTLICYNGEYKTISQWASVLNKSRHTISSRLQLGWSVEDAIELPKQKPYGSRKKQD